MIRLFLLWMVATGSTVCGGAETNSLILRVEQFVLPRLQSASTETFDIAGRDRILARPDPGTYFLRYAFGLKQHAKKLLTTEQSQRLESVLEKHKTPHTRWHDERNTLRCKYTEVMWRYAASDDSKADELRTQLESWMKLRMAWTRQEHLAQYRFARDVWNVLTPEQQSKLIAGEWKAYAKQDTGHTRSDAAAKIITRALGKTDDKTAFESAIAAWATQRAPLHEAVSEAEEAERRIVFAMDLNSESMFHAANLEATAAYSALYLAEADAIRHIVGAAYREPSPRCNQASTVAWQEAEDRFGHGAAELLEVLAKP